jgi:hypothetical protein
VIRSGEVAIERSQRDALDAISGKLATISKDGAEFDLELWTDAAMRTSEHWADVRRLAAAALDVFGWLQEDRPAEPEP